MKKKTPFSNHVFKFNSGAKLKAKREIGEGSFSSIVSTNDPTKLMKILNANDPKCDISYRNEKFAYDTLCPHPNIVMCFESISVALPQEANYHVFLLENCTGGNLI